MSDAAYYNEIDPYPAQWMRNLIDAGHIAPGVVDNRSILDVEPEDIGDGQAHFFAGIGVWSYALRLAGVPDGAAVWTGSCPCQPFSNAGKRRGADDERHLWPVWFRLIAERRPAIVFGEQVAPAAGRDWLAAVRADLEALGYAVGGSDLCAAGAGSDNARQRLFWVAYPTGQGLDGLLLQPETGRRNAGGALGDANYAGPQGHGRPVTVDDAGGREAAQRYGASSSLQLPPVERWLVECEDPVRGRLVRPAEPGTFPLAHGAPSRVGRLRAYGNAINARVAAVFIRSALDAIADAEGLA